MASRINRILSTLFTFRNAITIYSAKIFHFSVNELVLWSGERFAVANHNNNLGTILEVFYAHEYEDIREIEKTSPSIIIDIGANIGTFTVWAASILPKARIYSFEPESKNFELLTENISLNGINSRVTAVRAAVAGDTTPRVLSVADESSGKNSLSYDLGSGQTERVSCTTLDKIFTQHAIDSCAGLKLDCEGAEYEILYAASPDTLKRIGMIILEWHGVQGQSIDELISYLKVHGFSIQRSEKFPSMLTARRGANTD